MLEPSLGSSSLLALNEARVSPHEGDKSKGKASTKQRPRPPLGSETQARVTRKQSLGGSQHAWNVCPLRAAFAGLALVHTGIQLTGEQAQEEKVSDSC